MGKIEQERWLKLSCRWVEQEGSEGDCVSLLVNCKRFFRNYIPDDVKAALGAAYSRRYPGMAFNWNDFKMG